MSKKLDAEFDAKVLELGPVEAQVWFVQRDGHPFDVERTRREATAAIEALHARGLHLVNGTCDRP